MKKLFLLAIVLGAFMATSASAIPTSCNCYGGQDAGGGWWYLDDYNHNPLLNGDYVYAAWAGPDGLIDPPSTTGKAIGDVTGDDEWLKDAAISWGGFTLTVTVYDAGQHPTTGDLIYCRIFDGPQPLTTANYYGDSDLYACTHMQGEKFFCVFPGDPDEGYTDTPLPVELMSFDAIGRDGEVLLEWKTATETDCFGFHIERDGERITQKIIPGAGNSTTEQIYTYVDKGLTNGVAYYYNLITVDMDGVEMVANENPVAGTPTAHMPTAFAMHQNYPNPFNPYTDIKYDVPKNVHVTLKVYNVLGAEVATLVDADQEANFYTVRWDAKDLASGVYFCTITAGDFKAVKKMVLLK